MATQDGIEVGDLMRRDVELVAAASTIQEAAQLMADLDSRAVLVGENDVPRGILTDRDIIIRLVAAGRDPRETAVGDIMSSNIFYCRADDPVAAIAGEMNRRQIRQMPVRDAEKRWVGLITLSAIEEALGETARETRATPQHSASR